MTANLIGQNTPAIIGGGLRRHRGEFFRCSSRGNEAPFFANEISFNGRDGVSPSPIKIENHAQQYTITPWQLRMSRSAAVSQTSRSMFNLLFCSRIKLFD